MIGRENENLGLDWLGRLPQCNLNTNLKIDKNSNFKFSDIGRSLFVSKIPNTPSS